MTVQIELNNIKKTYGDQIVLENLNLDIMEGEFITLLGPSGCGKTTTLRILGGFEHPDEGQVLFNGKDITDLPAHLRPVNTLFQQYSLFPHLDVYENVAFGLRIKGTKEAEVRKRVSEMLQLVNLKGFEKRKVDSLSVQKELGITFIFVTHDQEEALSLSDRIVIMNEGIIQQIGTPTEIYNEPINAYVADFIGESNILEGVIHDDFDVTFSGHRFVCSDEGFRKDEAVDVVIRPEDLELVAPEEGMLKGTVLSSLFMGVHNEMIVQTKEEQYLVHTTLHKEVGEEVGIRIIPYNIHIMRKGEVEGDEDL